MQNKAFSQIGILIIVIIIIAGGIFAWQHYGKKAGGGEGESFSVLEAMNFFGETEVKTYTLGTAEFKIYPRSENFEAEEFQFGYFEAYSKGEKIYATEPVYAVSQLVAFEYKDDKYVSLSEYSGGAHCCNTAYLFNLDKEDNLKLIQALPLGNSDISQNGLLVKDGKLYLQIYDDRFAYFHTAYAASYFFKQYLLIEGDNMTLDNAPFKEDFLTEAQEHEGKLDQLYGEVSPLAEEEIQENYMFESWSGFLVAVTANYLLAGEEETAWQKFEEYFDKFSALSGQLVKELYSQAVDSEAFKQEIISRMAEERF